MALKDSISAIVSTYGDPLLVARGQVVDAKEVAAALAKAPSDTAEAFALRLLAKLNPQAATFATPPVEDAKTE